MIPRRLWNGSKVAVFVFFIFAPTSPTPASGETMSRLLSRQQLLTIETWTSSKKNKLCVIKRSELPGQLALPASYGYDQYARHFHLHSSIAVSQLLSGVGRFSLSLFRYSPTSNFTSSARHVVPNSSRTLCAPSRLRLQCLNFSQCLV